MANRFRGEADLKGESGKTYVLRFGSRALCRLLDEYDEPTDAALFARLAKELSPEGVSGVNQRVLRRVVLACSEPPINNDDEADQIIDDAGEPAVIEAFTACVYGREGGGKNPPKPARKKRIASGTSNSEPPPK